MRERGVHLCVVAPGSNLRFLLGYDAMAVDRLTALLVTPERAVMILPDFDAAEFTEAGDRPPAEGWADRDGPGAAVDAAFRRLGAPRDGAVVLVDAELPFGFYAELADRAGARPQLASALLTPLRLRKDGEAQQRIARTGELVSHGIDVALERAEVGMTERDLKRVIEAAMWDGGAESVDFVLVQAGPNAASPHHNADATPLRSGEPVLVDIAVRLEGHYADITQQVVLGDPPDAYVEHYEAVARAQEAGVRAAQAGATAHEVASAASAVIVDAGLGRWNGPRTGHGLGIDVHEPPSVVEGDRTVLEPGVVITVEPGIYIPGRYGIRIEDTVLVTDGGPRRLTRGARDLTLRRG